MRYTINSSTITWKSGTTNHEELICSYAYVSGTKMTRTLAMRWEAAHRNSILSNSLFGFLLFSWVVGGNNDPSTVRSGYRILSTALQIGSLGRDTGTGFLSSRTLENSQWVMIEGTYILATCEARDVRNDIHYHPASPESVRLNMVTRDAYM
ncbi:hypothetical protein ABKN59_001778 [Abortiporus biennis]